MKNHFFSKYGRAFVEILFLHPRSEYIRQLGLPSRIILYFLSVVLFYAPILYFIVKSSISNHTFILYYLIIGIMHVLSKFMLYNSKQIQKRFSTVKSRKNFFLRSWLIIEYIVFMWLVYLFYPLTCILAPISLLEASFESMFGQRVFLDWFLQNSEQFILFGGIASYILFIFIDGYRKMKTGFLPDYLGLYALLAIFSASIEGSMQTISEYLKIDITPVTSLLSEIFTLSNRSMNIVASGMTFFFAVYSLYTNYGTTDSEISAEGDQLEPKTDYDLQQDQ